MTFRPFHFVFLIQTGTNVDINRQRIAKLHCHEHRFAFCTKYKTVVPVGFQAARQAVFTTTVEVELDGTFQVFQNGAFALVGERKNLVVIIDVAQFLHVSRNRVEQPHAVVGTEVGFGSRCLVSRIVCKRFHNRHCATVGVLSCQHKFKTVNNFLWNVVDNAEHILNRVAVAHSVAFATVDERGRTAPRVRNQVVERIPHIYHTVESRIGSLCRKTFDTSVPVFHNFVEFDFDLGWRSNHFCRFFAFNPCFPDTKHYGKFLCLARLQVNIYLQRTATVVAFGKGIATFSVSHNLRICIRAICSQEFGTVAVVTRNFLTHNANERVTCLVFILEIVGVFGHIQVAAVVNETVFVGSLNNVLRILQIVAVVVHIPVRGKFNVGERTQFAGFLACVGDFYVPHLEFLSHRHEIKRFGLYVAIFRRNFCVGRTVTAFALVFVKRFAYWLPRTRPEILAFAVVDVQIATGLVERHIVEFYTKKTTLHRRAEK